MTTPEQQAEELLPCEFEGTATVCTANDPPICASCERRPAVAAIIAQLRSELAVAQGAKKYPIVTKQMLLDVGLNAFAVELVAESLLKHPNPKNICFAFEVNRGDCPKWWGVKFELILVQDSAWIAQAERKGG